MLGSTLILSFLVTGCVSSPLVFGEGQNPVKLDVSIGFESNPVVNFFNLLKIAFDRFQYLATKLTADGTSTVGSSVGLFVNAVNATFDLVRGTTIRTIDDFIQKAGGLQDSLSGAVSSGWDLAGDLFLSGQYFLALPVTAFTIYLKTIYGALAALRFEMDAGLNVGSNSTTISH